MRYYSVSVVYTIYSSLDSVERILPQAVVYKLIYNCNYNVSEFYLFIDFIFINLIQNISKYVQKL